MTLCLVQPNSKTKYLRLWRYDYSLRETPCKGWVHKSHSVPYEVEDTRFRDSVRLLSRGWMFFYDSESPLKGDKPIEISENIRLSVMNDLPTVPVDDFNIDFSSFWRNYRKAEAEEIKRENLKELRKNPLKVILPTTAKKLLTRYEQGEKLPYYALRLIKKNSDRCDNEHQTGTTGKTPSNRYRPTTHRKSG